jgi:ABC-2 type transport system permease protein
MNAWLMSTTVDLKVMFRDRQTLFWSYVFPLFFLFLFCSIFARGRAEAVGGLMPGLLTISTMGAGFFGLSIGLVTARERGILRRYRLAPIHPWLIITSALVSNFLITVSSLLFQLAVAKVVYGLTIVGSWWTFVIMVSVGVLAFLSLGFVIAAVAENTKVAPVMGNILFFPLMFLGGAAIPMAFLPPTIRKIGEMLPSSYMVNGLTRIVVNGEELGAVVRNLVVLAATAVVALILASKLFRWESGERLPLAKKAWAAAIILVFVVAALWTGR